MFSSAILVVAVVVGAALVSSQAPTVTGSIVVGSTKVAPKSVVAVGYTAPNGRLVSVLVSDKPSDGKEFAELTKVGTNEPLVAGIIEGAWKSMHFDKKLSGFVFTINADKKILSNEFLIGGPNDAFSISADDLVLALTSTTPRLAGRIRTTEPTLSLGSQKVGLDVTFDVLVTTPGK